jgi:hypothetical protein
VKKLILMGCIIVATITSMQATPTTQKSLKSLKMEATPSPTKKWNPEKYSKEVESIIAMRSAVHGVFLTASMTYESIKLEGKQYKNNEQIMHKYDKDEIQFYQIVGRLLWEYPTYDATNDDEDYEDETVSLSDKTLRSLYTGLIEIYSNYAYMLELASDGELTPELYNSKREFIRAIDERIEVLIKDGYDGLSAEDQLYFNEQGYHIIETLPIPENPNWDPPEWWKEEYNK